MTDEPATGAAAHWSIAAAIARLAAATALVVQTWYFKPLRIDWFYGRLFASFALHRPELLSHMRILPSWLEFYGGDLDDESPAEARRRAELVRAGLDTLRRYDR